MSKVYWARLWHRFIANLPSWVLVIFTAFNFVFYFKILAKPTFSVNYSNEIFIEQVLGNLNFYHFISIKNIGSKVGYVTKIEGYIRSKDRDVSIFKRRIKGNYYYCKTGNSYFLEIALSPNESFESEVQMFKEPDRITRDSAAVIQSLMINESDEFKRKSAFESFKPVFFSKKMTALIDDFNKKRVGELTQGEYEYIIQITQDNKKVFEKCYSFFIYPDNIFQFKEAIKDLKRYDKFANIFNPIRRPNLGLPLTEIQNPEIIRSLEEELKK